MSIAQVAYFIEIIPIVFDGRLLVLVFTVALLVVVRGRQRRGRRRRLRDVLVRVRI